MISWIAKRTQHLGRQITLMVDECFCPMFEMLAADCTQLAAITRSTIAQNMLRLLECLLQQHGELNVPVVKGETQLLINRCFVMAMAWSVRAHLSLDAQRVVDEFCLSHLADDSPRHRGFTSMWDVFVSPETHNWEAWSSHALQIGCGHRLSSSVIVPEWLPNPVLLLAARPCVRVHVRMHMRLCCTCM